MNSPAKCHPDKPIAGLGLCRLCYGAHRRRNWINPCKATCHPDRPYLSKGLCSACYKRSNLGTKDHQDALALKSRLKCLYGMSLDDYNSRVAQQNGMCALCGQVPKTRRKLHVDHDHGTGAIRGLLCHHCNVGLGCFMDDPATLSLAIEYLTTHGSYKI